MSTMTPLRSLLGWCRSSSSSALLAPHAIGSSAAGASLFSCGPLRISCGGGAAVANARLTLPPFQGGTSSQASPFSAVQIRAFAGRAGGKKRKRRSNVVHTPHQTTTLGKRMEFFWPKEFRRTRVPLVENSRQHVIYDTRFRTWMTMW